MTLTILDGLEQGSTEWHDARRGLVTASVVGKLLTPTLRVADNDTSRALTETLIAERISGFTEETHMTSDMFRGVLSEPIARDLYSTYYSQAVECGFLIREEDGWTLGYSPDGVVGSEGLLEVKAPRARTHLRTILADEVPAHYMAQCQAGLLVSGRKWLDFLSYCGAMPIFVKRVYPDPAWFDAIEAACRAFEERARDVIADYHIKVRGLPIAERIPTDLELVV